MAGAGWRAWVDPTWEVILRSEIERGFAPPQGNEVARPQGRTRHLIYLPQGAPASVFVRFGHRGGAVRFLGGRYLRWWRVPAELEVLHYAREHGVPVPRPLAGAAWRRGLLGWSTAVVTQAIPDAVPVLEHPDRRTALRAAGRAVRSMLQAGIAHPDLHPGNILVERRDASRAWLIDFDRAFLAGGPLSPHAVVERMLRALRRHGQIVGRTDRLRFMRSLGADPRMCPP